MRWTGDAVANGTAVTTGNVNTAGNGDTVAFNSSGTFTAAYGEGLEVTGAAAAIARLDLAYTAGKGAVGQIFYRPWQQPVGAAEILFLFRSASATAGSVVHRPSGELTFQNSANAQNAAYNSPALIVGHLYQIDVVAALSASPTTSNGRMFYRVRDLTDPTWNTTGEFFIDTGYTLNLGTVDLSNARVGRVSNASGAIATGTPSAFSQIGWDAATVSTSTDPTIAKSHFMAAPAANTPPTASAGTDQAVATGTLVTLHGTDSDTDGTIASRQWTKSSGPAATLSSSTVPAPTFTPAAAGTYVFSYVVTDNAGATSTPDSVTITVVDPPVVAYARISVVEIDASGSTGGTPTLTQTSGPTVSITGPTAGVFQVALPEPLTANVVLSLSATNAGGTDIEAITISPPGGGVLVRTHTVFDGTSYV